MASYELWLTDDAGRRIQLLKKPFYFTYTRTLTGLGTFSLGIPLKDLDISPYFKVDWRVDVWRSASYGVPMRREDSFLLREPNVYTRAEDAVQILQYYGRNGIDLLHRRSVIQRGATSQASKTDQVDDMMKAIVREQMLYGSAVDEDGASDNGRAWPQNEFSVQADVGLGPTVTRAFPGRMVYDVLKELKEASFQLNVQSASNRRIYFDMVPQDLDPSSNTSASPLGWQFRTYADRRGADRTGGIEFSLENENIEKPSYSISHLEEASSIVVLGNGQATNQPIQVVEDAARVNSSRWNRVEKVINASGETDSTGMINAGYAELYKSKPLEKLDVTLLNTPGSDTTPRSLYGVDWDLGDWLRVNYAGRQFIVEVAIVYVSVDEDGKETITGRNDIQQ